MDTSPIREEKTSYTVLLYRKSRGLRLAEMGLFLAGLLMMVPFFEKVRSTPFIVALLLWAGVLMTGVPALYRLLLRPAYTLYPDRLVIRFSGRREEVALSRVKPSHVLPHVYEIDGKRRPLLVSDDFLEDLNVRLEMKRRGLSSDGKP
ncbi:hypothetical protein C8P63_11469 [Melghirimyces profundicolus]|uniref:Uncharacterized protein n=1 Tax=Melghirimyces profundicolus TaxID=1242148 RepID=A0A2T6BSG7_9BACL|nr:hypothetical protein [Melghirimyces profundicolus]PTX58887.1 hypothetical protein C8P63_11469 [Melghirimyces profundicolus]